MSWRKKADEIIKELSWQAYLEANTTKAGARRRRHQPYHLPQTANDLVECLNEDDEERAKSIMMYDFDALQTWGRLR